MAITVKRPIPVFLLTEPRDVVVEMDHERSEGQLHSRQPTGAVVVGKIRPALGSLLLCHLYDGAGEGTGEFPALTLEGVIIGSVAESMDSTVTSGYVLRWNWAFSREGETALRHDLMEYFAYPSDRLEEQTVISFGASAIFPFRAQRPERLERVAQHLSGRPLPSPKTEVAPETTTQQGLLSPLLRLRRHERVRVDVPCRLRIDDAGRERKGRIYNLGREGVFIASPEELPGEGDSIRLAIALRHRGQQRKVQLRGAVRWPMQRCDNDVGGGFGVEVREVSDGDEGKLFHAFLDFLISRHLAGQGRTGTRSTEPAPPNDPNAPLGEIGS